MGNRIAKKTGKDGFPLLHHCVLGRALDQIELRGIAMGVTQGYQ